MPIDASVGPNRLPRKHHGLLRSKVCPPKRVARQDISRRGNCKRGWGNPGLPERMERKKRGVKSTISGDLPPLRVNAYFSVRYCSGCSHGPVKRPWKKIGSCRESRIRKRKRRSARNTTGCGAGARGWWQTRGTPAHENHRRGAVRPMATARAEASPRTPVAPAEKKRTGPGAAGAPGPVSMVERSREERGPISSACGGGLGARAGRGIRSAA